MVAQQKPRTTAELIKRADDLFGSNVFLRYERDGVIKDITYNEFKKLCESVAGWTEDKSKELGRKIRVGIFAGSSRGFLASLFGVMGNGNVAIPLDIQMDMDTLADCINRADIDYLFFDWDNLERVEGAISLCPNLIDTVCLQKRKHKNCIQNIWKEYTDCELNYNIDEKECAMILFTSGTTGKGKGVMLSHENLMDNTFCTEVDGHDSNEVVLNVLPVHHVFCLHGDFMYGLKYGNIVCLNQDMAKLGQHLQMFQPTIMTSVPMIAKALFNKVTVLKQQLKDKTTEEIKNLVFGKNLRQIACGGGYLSPELANGYREIGIEAGQGYGMTECSPKISCIDWERPDKVASVGKVVEGCEIRFVDGEIQVKSKSVMMGYYKDPEETAKSLTEDGWLRTGDLGYVDDEGYLFFTGRCKNLIILSK